MKNELSILVLGCLKHEQIAQRMFALLSMYWKEAYESALLCTDEADPYLENIAPGRVIAEPSGNYAERIKKGLEALPEDDYVLILLDDYYLTESIDHEAYMKLVDSLSENKISYCKLVGLPRCFKKDKRVRGTYRIKKSTHYGISLQPSIWRKESLLEALSLCKGGNPWQVEAVFSSYQVLHHESCITFNKNYLHFKNGILRGKLFPYTNRLLVRNGLEPLDLERVSYPRYWWFSFKQHAAMHVPIFIRKVGKKIGSLLGKKYYSEN